MFEVIEYKIVTKHIVDKICFEKFFNVKAIYYFKLNKVIQSMYRKKLYLTYQ